MTASYTLPMTFADGSGAYALSTSFGESDVYVAVALAFIWAALTAWRERRSRKVEDEARFRRTGRRIGFSFLAIGILWPLVNLSLMLLLLA